MKTLLWTVFAAMAAAQIAVPAYMIVGREIVLREGTPYKLECGPVDPYDVFRGRYVALAFADEAFENWTGPSLDYGAPVYVRLAEGDDGFARIADVTTARPGGDDYLEVTVNYADTANKRLLVRFPFDRYYMDEFQAPAAEAAYFRERREETEVYVVVRVRGGAGVIEGLYIGDTPIETYVRQEPAPATP